jgi:hypothetical protein
MNGLLYIFGGFIVLILGGIIAYQLRLFRHRGVSREDFIKEFRKRDLPEAIPAAVYDYYRSSAMWKGFKVSPDDAYAKVFREEHEDIDDDAEQLVKQLGMHMPPEYVRRQWEKRLETLRDMVLWLDWIRQHQPKGADVLGQPSKQG